MARKVKLPRVAREPDPPALLPSGTGPAGGSAQGKRSVAVGMSGGVDSSVAAALLVECGYDVTGVYLECWNEPGCRAPEDRKDALSVALALGIPFQVLDFQKEYREKVIEYFYREYEAGRTPNPDVVCNREIKFGLFLRWTLKHGFDYMATGHYARIGVNSGGSAPKVIGLARRVRDRVCFQQYAEGEDLVLLRGVDEWKDQTYFLYTLTQEKLRHILFPVGYLTKKEVRALARKRGLSVADKRDSTGICFVGEVDVKELLRRRIPEKEGNVVDMEGNVIGRHRGVWFYTIGERHGFTLSSKFPLRYSFEGQAKVKNSKLKHAIPPFYVVGKDVVRNRLIVGFGAETFRDKFQVNDLHWIDRRIMNHESRIKGDFRVRIRHGGELIPAMLENSKFEIRNSKFLVRLSEPVRGIAPGQGVVFYRGEECLGGGVIAR